tara:strand:+ start:931 stop:1143 length:213 start_codon:yes stop_codon:yes gene_type:complete
MKIKFDERDIQHASMTWFDQLDRIDDTPHTKRCLDDCDLAYIQEIMESNPKLKRLMPYIIQETIMNYEEF